MVWYAHHGVGVAMSIPAAAAGALLPYALAPGVGLRDALLGLALLFGGIASMATSFGNGSSFLLAAVGTLWHTGGTPELSGASGR